MARLESFAMLLQPQDKRRELSEVARLFLKLGATAFGGPAAHIALMEHEVVRRRQWLSREEFLDLLGATNLIPGPNSTEMAIHIGHRRAGWAGLVVAGLCFILPATLIVTLMAWAYVRFGQLPKAEGLLYGIKPVIIAIIVQALWGFGRTALKSNTLVALGLGVVGLAILGIHELILLFGAGLIMGILHRAKQRGTAKSTAPPASSASIIPFLAVGGGAGGAGAAAAAVSFSYGSMFLFFLKVGAVLYGSGYVLLAFLRADLVDRWQWLTEAQLLDAIAVGQFTPGPLFTTATFIGYLLGGVSGAGLATVGIFLPAFVFVAISGPLIPRLRRSPTAGAVLDGVNVASLALMAVVTVYLGRGALVDLPTLLLAILSGLFLARFRLNSAWLVMGGGVVGLAVKWPWG